MLTPLISTLVAAGALSIATGAGAPESKYIELAAPFTAVGTLGEMGTGTLISDRWVITAAHVADFLRLRGKAPMVFRFDDGQEYTVDRVEIYPTWAPLEQQMANRRENEPLTPGDVALLRLTEPVAGVAPATLGAFDADHPEIMLVGVGAFVAAPDTGVPMREVMRMPRGVRHAGTNVVDRVDDARKELVVSFSPPQDAAATTFEASAFAGDSGGPLFGRNGDAWEIIGIIGMVDAAGGKLGAHGDETRAASVSAIREWIDAQLCE